MKRDAESQVAELPVDAIRVGKRYRQHMGDIAGLAASIAEHGLMHPIVVTPERDLVAGERRLVAVRSLGWTTVPVRVVTPANLLKAESDENAVRADFLPSEAVAIAKALEPGEQAAAKVRMTEKVGKLSLPSKGKVIDRVAAAVGMSGPTLAKAMAVVDAADADPELGDIAERMDATGSVDGAFRELERRVKARPADYVDLMPPAMAERELEDRRLARWGYRMNAAVEALQAVTPADYIPHLSPDDRELTEIRIGLIEDWIRWTRDALADGAPVRLVGGTR